MNDITQTEININYDGKLGPHRQYRFPTGVHNVMKSFMSNMAANGNIQKKIFAIEMLSNSNKGTFYIDESEINEIALYVNDNESNIIDMSYCISRSGEMTFWFCDIKGVSISVFKTQIYDINKIWFVYVCQVQHRLLKHLHRKDKSLLILFWCV